MILPTSNYQLDIGGGQFIFLQILMLCDILASQKHCSINAHAFYNLSKKVLKIWYKQCPPPLNSK